MNFILKEKTLLLNIFVSFIVYFLIVLSQKYTCLITHDYSYPFGPPDMGRFPSWCYGFLFNNFLPNLFNMHPADFRSGVGIGCLILSLIYYVICLLFAKGFFINSSDNRSIFRQKEFMLVFPLSFILLSLPFGTLDNTFTIYNRMEDLSITAEFFFNYIPLFSFLLFFFYCIKEEKKLSIKSPYCIISIILSFMAGAYNEVTNLICFFCLLIMTGFLFCFDKKRLYNKNILYPVIPLILGMFHYYILCNNFLDITDGFYHLDFFSNIIDSLSAVDIFLPKFYSVIIESKLIYFMIIGVLAYFLLKKENKDTNISVYFGFSLIIGYFLVSLLTLFLGASIYGGFLFERHFQDCVYVNILEFSILVFLGATYNFFKRKHILNVILAILILIFAVQGITYELERQRKNFYIKSIVYNINKQCLIYSCLGETVLLPSAFRIISTEYGEKLRIIRKYRSRYIERYYIVSIDYKNYFLNIYKKNFDGCIFLDDKISEVEFNKRLELLDETRDDMNPKFGEYISFKRLYEKYKGKKFTSQELLEIQEKKGKSPVLTKALAYAYYQEKNYEKAIALYQEYLVENSNDFDANLNIATMYKHMGKEEDAISYMMKLNYANDEEAINLYNLLSLYYDVKDKDKCIEICDKLIKLNESNGDYINKAIVYAYFGDIELATKVIVDASKKDKGIMKIWTNLIRNDIEFPKNTKLMIQRAYL